MTSLLSELNDSILWITLNRVEKHNAFDDELLQELHRLLIEAQTNPLIRVIGIKANGKNFCAGADLTWMQRVANHTLAENEADALLFAETLQMLYTSTKPTLAVVQGACLGGGAGLVAACDIAIASTDATFCFSEVTLGLIPAVISPYVIAAIGAKAAMSLFLTANAFNAERAYALNLIQHHVSPEHLIRTALKLTQRLSQLPPQTLATCKRLVRDVSSQPIDDALVRFTAKSIAHQRMSPEGLQGIHAFLNKVSPDWK